MAGAEAGVAIGAGLLLAFAVREGGWVFGDGRWVLGAGSGVLELRPQRPSRSSVSKSLAPSHAERAVLRFRLASPMILAVAAL